MTKNISIKTFIASAVTLAVFAFALVAYANPFYQAGSAQVSTSGAATLGATSTKVVMTPGTATSTPVYDSYEVLGTNQANTGNNTLAQNVAILVDGLASSTLTTVSIACEYSANWNGTNGDWYQNEILAASTTSGGVQNVGLANSYSFAFASSSSLVGGSGNVVSNNRFSKLVTCPVPVRFVRAVVTITGARAMIWTAIVPTKERN